jgi:hypothetical protein
MFRELFVIFQIIQIVKQMQYFLLMQIYEEYFQGKTWLVQLLVERRGDNLHKVVTILTW